MGVDVVRVEVGGVKLVHDGASFEGFGAVLSWEASNSTQYISGSIIIHHRENEGQHADLATKRQCKWFVWFRFLLRFFIC